MEQEKCLIMLPGPTNVPDRVMQAMKKPIINHRGPEFGVLHESIAENLRYVFQTKKEVFVLTSSGTGGVECAVGNIVNPGDKVIVPVYGLFSQRLKEKIDRRGGKAIELSLEWGDAPTGEQIMQTVEGEKDVKAMAVVYNETSTGVTVRDLPEIAKIARENDLLLIVDAISILGGAPLPVDKWGIDLCVTGSQKCLACPPGLAMVSVSERAWEAIEKTAVRPYYFDLVFTREFNVRKETPFTPALPIFYALDEALKMIREEGLENRFKRHEKCAKAFYGALEALELTPYAKERVRSNTVIAIKAPARVNVNDVTEIMRKQYRVVIAEGVGKLKHSMFRIGCMGIVSEAETLTTINAFENALADVKYPVRIGAGIEGARQIFHS